MPLVVMSGYPSSGKSLRTNQLKEFFHKKYPDKRVLIVTGDENLDRNQVFMDSHLEKELRGRLMAEVQRNISRDSILLLDSANYIKGFRYELYCFSKSVKTTQCTIMLPVNVDKAWTFNCSRPEKEQYSREVFDALISRYEEPDSKNRWDSPLIIVHQNEELPFEEVDAALFQRKAPTPNQATMAQPLLSTNFLYDVDRLTQETVDKILKDPVKYVNRKVTLPELSRLRRQFITYLKLNPVENTKAIDRLRARVIDFGDPGQVTESQDGSIGTDNDSVIAYSVTSPQESTAASASAATTTTAKTTTSKTAEVTDKRLCLRSRSALLLTKDVSTTDVPRKRFRQEYVSEEEEAPPTPGLLSPISNDEPRSTQSLEFVLQQAAASLEQRSVRESKERRLADAQRNLSEKQYLDEEEIEISDKGDSNEPEEGSKDRTKRRRRNATKFTQPPKNKKGKKESPSAKKNARKEFVGEAAKSSKSKEPLKVKFCGKLLSKRKREVYGPAVMGSPRAHSRNETQVQTATTSTPTRKAKSTEPNRLHVAATPGVYALKKRGEWFMCAICEFKSKQVADIARHLRNYDYYTAHCPLCKHVVTKAHRGPDNKILSCLHCDYRNGDHVESNTPKEDIVAIAAKTIYDDDEEPQIVSEITDECGNPVKVLSTERDLEELRKMGAVTLNTDVSPGSLAHVSITADDSDVIRIDVAAPSVSKGSPAKPKRIPAILQRRKKR